MVPDPSELTWRRGAGTVARDLRATARLTALVPASRPARTAALLEGPVIARIDDLMDKVDSKFHLVHLAAQRAREINGYYAQLGEGLGTHVPPLVSVPSNKPLSIALEEISQGKIEGVEPSEDGAEDPLGFIGGDDDLGA
ncbi:MAG: DNA-directed RNA polymerase subunit omega [Nitriliruptor sp.]